MLRFLELKAAPMIISVWSKWAHFRELGDDLNRFELARRNASCSFFLSLSLSLSVLLFFEWMSQEHEMVNWNTFTFFSYSYFLLLLIFFFRVPLIWFDSGFYPSPICRLFLLELNYHFLACCLCIYEERHRIQMASLSLSRFLCRRNLCKWNRIHVEGLRRWGWNWQCCPAGGGWRVAAPGRKPHLTPPPPSNDQ